MGCQCGREDLSESILNHFWNELNLRSKSHQDIIDMIRSKKQSANEQIKENKFIMLIQDLIEGNDFKEQTEKIFKDALNVARKEYKNEGLLYLSLLLLGTGNADDFIKGFISLSMTQGGLKYYIENKENKSFIIRKEIENFIEYYVNMVTLLGVKHLSTLTDNKELFEETLNKAFDVEHQKQYIKEVILKDVSDDKKVDMIAFFKGTYERLKIDMVIRQELYKNYLEKEQNAN